MHAARSASTAAWAGHTIAIADAPETPERIKQATRSGDLADAVDQVRTVDASDDVPAQIQLAEEDEDAR